MQFDGHRCLPNTRHNNCTQAQTKQTKLALYFSFVCILSDLCKQTIYNSLECGLLSKNTKRKKIRSFHCNLTMVALYHISTDKIIIFSLVRSRSVTHLNGI